MAAQNLLAGCAACTTCLEKQNCCMSADACLADTGCNAYATCMNDCYDGMTADGGNLPDASQNSEDTCANNCPGGSTASMTLYNNFNNCASPSCDTPCECP